MDTKFSSAIHMLILVSEAEKPMNSEQIALSVGTNPSYIRKISTRLSKAGIIEGRKGISGFTLTKKSKDISLFDIYNAVMETEHLHLFDIHKNPNDECIVGNNINPVLTGMFRDMENEVEKKLNGISLEDCIKIMAKRVKENRK